MPKNDTDSLIEFREFFMGFKQEAAKLAADMPNIMARIEAMTRQIYAANALKKVSAKQAFLTQVAASAVVPTRTPSPPLAITALNNLVKEQAKTNRVLAETQMRRTLLTADPRDYADPRAVKQLNATLGSLAKLNREIHKLAMTQGDPLNASKRDETALTTKIDQAIKINAKLRTQLNKDKVDTRHSHSKEPGAPTHTHRRRPGR